ncbi:MAG: cytochrome c-type biogenesis protein CcmF [Candidatus Tokpelaia sp. JSC188]|nr:MAG: cytochrome c-type biogenesis protein CcmF [Candidatus Tokpelaia sp. JSC188]
MIVEVGHFLLILALALSIYQIVVPIFGIFCHDKKAIITARPIAMLVFVLVALSFFTLIYAYITSDFSVLNVAQNSHSEKPLLFKITGVWGNHEGSMMLWVLILTFFSALVAIFCQGMPVNFIALVLVCQSFIVCAFLAFILVISNPFQRIAPPVFQGRGLNPILQDIGLALHPPLLYLGYVGFSVCFSSAIAVLLNEDLEVAFGSWMRSWALLSWMFLTAGITIGSYWAYYEIGWGGYWSWDPVENASLMPWLSGTALLHSAIMLEKHSSLKIWNIFLAIITFSLSLLGTFLVRSNILTSVHSFSIDPRRGIAILCILIFFIGNALLLFAFRASSIKSSSFFQPISREGALVFNTIFLIVAVATILIGTLYPMLLETLTGEKISVGAPFFNLTFSSLIVPLLIAMPFGSLLFLKKGDTVVAAGRLYLILALAIMITVFVFHLQKESKILSAAGFGLAFWVVIGTLANLTIKTRNSHTSPITRWNRIKKLPNTFSGKIFAHMGLGVTLFGILAVASFREERIANIAPGDAVRIAGKDIYFDGYMDYSGENYYETRLYFTLVDGGERGANVMASKRTFPSQNMQVTKVGLLRCGLSQYYIAPSDYTDNNKIIVHIYWNPWVLCIWLGGFLMVAGSIFSFSIRHLRMRMLA